LNAIQEEEDGISMADQMTLLEPHERKKMQEEHKRSFGSGHVEVGGGDAQELDQWTRDFVLGLESIVSRPSRGMARSVSARWKPFACTSVPSILISMAVRISNSGATQAVGVPCNKNGRHLRVSRG
jgi:hypothetical protein